MDVLKWKNEKTKRWIDENVAYKNWQINGDSILVDQKKWCLHRKRMSRKLFR